MQLLRLARVVFGIPVGALAAKAGISVREVSRIERGDVRPKPDTLDAIDAAFVALIRARFGAGRMSALIEIEATAPAGIGLPCGPR